MRSWATGKNAFGFCDRCGQRYAIAELRQQVVNRVLTDLRVCPECMDIDHEQYGLDRVDATDVFTLQYSRPDQSQSVARSLFGFGPVLGVDGHILFGIVNVRIS